MRITTSFLFVAAALAVGCSSGYSSGVSGSKPVADLTAAEAELACENFSDFLLANLPESKQERFNCYSGALVDVTRTPAECDTAFNDCMMNPPSFPLDVGPLNCDVGFVDPTCNATVAEAEACINADAQAILDWIDSVNCTAAGNIPLLQDLAEAPPVPDECAVLSARCPLFGNGFFR